MKRVLAILLSLLMLVGCLPLASLAVSAEMGGDFPWTGSGDKMLIEEILERDGLIDGIWMPWFNEGQTGHNLTGNELMAKYNSSSAKDWNRVEMDYYGADKIYREIYNLKAMGYNVLAYGGSIFAEGVVFDDNGDVVGIKQEYLNNARRLLDMCREIGMPVMWNIYFHSSSLPSYYGIEGWHFVTQMLGNRDVADNYAEKFVRPLCEMLAEYPDVVALVSIADEPENEINDLGKGDHFATNGREMYGVTQEDMIYFMQQINEVAREELPNVARTVASNSGNKTIYRDFDLDLMGHNQYTDGDSFKSVESLLTDADPILTEYNVANRFSDDTAYANKLIAFREWMMANGYKGGFQWCWTPGQYTGAYALQRNTSGTAFRKTVALLRYYMDEYRAAYRGETITLDAPVLYANTDNGKVQFIPSKRATKITIQRSDDGGNTWKTLVSDVNQSSYVDSYLIGSYTDTTTRPTSGYCYRIIAKDASGNSVTSEPNDVAGTAATFKKTFVAPTYKAGEWYITSSLQQSAAKLTSFGTDKNRPMSESVNLIENGDFESTGGQWNNNAFLQYASVVNDATTPSGNKSLYFNTANVGTAGWYNFTVTGLKANTEYTFSTFIKGAFLSDSNKGDASIGVIDPDTGKFMFYWEYFRSYPRSSRETKQIYPTAYDNDWHIRSVTFNTGARTSATIALYGASSQIWLDGMALYESSNGVKYDNGESSKAVTSTKYEPASGATNAVADPAVNNAAYWNTGAGYKQGFMSIASGALKYTASSDPKGVRYTKWIDVKPGTDYYVSYTVKVTTAGNGRVAILDDAKLLPFENMTTSFSTTGTKTVTGRISTGKYDQLGLCVVDLGGVATIDNIYLYEAGESVVVPTTPSFDGYILNGDFEIGSSTGWENLWNNNTVELVDGRDSLFALKGVAGDQYAQVRQKITVEPNTDYVIDVWAKNVSGTTLIVKDMSDANLKQTGLLGSGSTWTKTTMEFNSGSNTWIHLGFMGGVAGNTWTVDDVTMYKKPILSDDGFLVNGDFEVGSSNGWENLGNGNTIQMVSGRDSQYAIKVSAGEWSHVRQTNIPVEKNTDYIIELWCKDAVYTSLLVKDGGDTTNMKQTSLPGGSTWQKVELEFNSGNYSSVIVTLMGTAVGATYTVDDVKMYKKEIPVGVLNGDFEAGEQNWTFGSGSHAIVGDAHGGNNALQLTNPGKWGSAAEQTIAVDPNTSYTITWWYKATSSTGLYNLYVMNASGYANLASEGGKNYMQNYTGGWEKGTYVVNSGNATAMILKFSTEVDNPGTIIVDDIVVTKTEDFVCQHTYTSAVTKAATCGATGVRTYTCGNCGDSYTETIPATGNHTYDNACDANCNVCGATRTVSHVYSGACDNYCNLCGAKKSGFSIGVSHTYDNACDADCNVCGEVRNVAGHAYDNACDDTCNNCGAVRDVAHTYDNACDADCNVCGETRTPAAHRYVKTTMAAGNCGTEGMDKYTCSVCGDTYTKLVPATGNHTYDNDCDNKCNVCNKIREVGDHKYVGVETKAPTCGTAGVMTYTCSSCGDSYTQTIPATGEHKYYYPCLKECYLCGEETRPEAEHAYILIEEELPTCSQQGTRVYECRYCYGLKDVFIPVDSERHLAFELIDSKEPICTEDGYNTYGCCECDYQYTEVIPATGEHKYYYPCLKECYLCGEETRPEAEHSYVLVWEERPTCSEEGIKTYECRYCYGLKDVIIPATGEHLSFELVGEQEPTCTEDGYNTYMCCYCDYRYTEAVPALGHSWIAADCDTAKTCDTCGATEGEALGHAYGHDYDVDCDTCGAIREVSLPVSFGGNSVSEDVSGLAFRFDVEVKGMAVNETTAIYEGATVNGYKLISMGAIATNGVSELDVKAVYLCDLSDTTASYAVRVIKIPTDKYDAEITATPYFVVEINGEATIIYGEAQTSTFNEAALNSPVA